MAHRILRTSVLIPLAFAAVCWCQDQKAPQPAAPPVSVNVVMPPQNPWNKLLEILLSGIVGASGALIAVWLTTKRNAAENSANREHQLEIERIKEKITSEAKSRDNQWEFRKNVYVNLIKATSGLLRINSLFSTLTSQTRQLVEAKTNPASGVPPKLDILPRLKSIENQLNAAVDEYDEYGIMFSDSIHLAPLAVAEDVLPLVSAAKPSIFKMSKLQIPLEGSVPIDIPESTTETVAALHELLRKLQSAARTDLWGIRPK